MPGAALSLPAFLPPLKILLLRLEPFARPRLFRAKSLVLKAGQTEACRVWEAVLLITAFIATPFPEEICWRERLVNLRVKLEGLWWITAVEEKLLHPALPPRVYSQCEGEKHTVSNDALFYLLYGF